jgi:hypothetical protein
VVVGLAVDALAVYRRLAIGTVATIAGSAAQIVLTQVVARERLVERTRRTRLHLRPPTSLARVRPGVLIKLVGAPLALLADAVLLAISAAILRGIQVQEGVQFAAARFWPAMRAGLVFVARHRLLLTMACIVGGWQMCHHAALVVQILFATRTLGLSEGAVGLCFVGLGVGTIAASTVGNRIARRLGPGPTLVLGVAICGAGWLLGSIAPASTAGERCSRPC